MECESWEWRLESEFSSDRALLLTLNFMILTGWADAYRVAETIAVSNF